MVNEDWRARAARMGRTTARLREGHMPDIQVWSTRMVRPTRDPCITCGEPLDNGRSGGRRCAPDQEDGTDASQRGVERFGHGEIADHDLDLRRQPRCGVGPARECPDRHTRTYEFVDHETPDPARRTGDEHRKHARSGRR